MGYFLFGSIINAYIKLKHIYIHSPFILGFNNLFGSGYIIYLTQFLSFVIAFLIVINYYKSRLKIERGLSFFIIFIKVPPLINYLIYSIYSDGRYTRYELNYFLAFLIHSIPLFYFFADRYALNYLSKLTGKEFKLSEEPDSRNYKEELLALKEAFIKTRKGNIVFVILLFIYISPLIIQY